jgi:hypothetical protein
VGDLISPVVNSRTIVVPCQLSVKSDSAQFSLSTHVFFG